jgi:KDO2-lipid IV(A) lauroyltransferase
MPSPNRLTAKYAAYRTAQWFSLRLPARAARRCADRLADLWGRLAVSDRAAVRANLSLVLDRPVGDTDPMLAEVFRSFGRYLVEFFTSHRLQDGDVRVEGGDRLADALRRRRGAIILTAHLGNWELGAVVLKRMGWPVSVVALPHPDARMDRLFNRQRERCGLEVIPLGPQAARRSLQTLQSGGLLGLLGDREFADNGLRVSLCGRPVALPRGPAVVCLRSQAPILPVFLLREGELTFRFCLEPPIEPPARQVDEPSVRAVTERYAAVLEQYLRRHPTQWLLFQPAEAAGGDPRLAGRDRRAALNALAVKVIS